MSTSLPTLTLAQLREDIEALASVHPGSYPTNVIVVVVKCGEVIAEFDTSEEDALREELKNAEETVSDVARTADEATARADKAEEESQTLREEMEAISLGEETILTYRTRALQAEDQCAQAYELCRAHRAALEEAQRETKALRTRKGVPAGVFKNIHSITQLLAFVSRSMIHKQHAEEAAQLLKEIQTA